MFRVTLKANDAVLVMTPTAEAEFVVFGSVRVHCDECGVECWRAPGNPLVELTTEELKPAPIVQPPITILLCVSCALMHMSHH